jgi:hypothetical protein
MPTSRFFRLLPDSAIADLWFLGEPIGNDDTPIDPRTFTSSRRFGKVDSELRLPVKIQGRVCRFSFGPFDMPVVTPDVRDSLAALVRDEVEFIPATAADREVAILNVVRTADCINVDRTVGERWTELDGFPKKVGKYRTIAEIVLDPQKIANDLFRIEGWKIALVASERLIDAAQLDKVEGLAMEAVT